MILVDVNLLVYAFRSDSPLHQTSRQLLLQVLSGSEPFLFLPQVAASFLRLVTNPKIFVRPSPLAEAWNFVEALQDNENAVFAEVDAMTLGIFKHMSLIHHAAGNQIPDVLLAALALRHEAELLTADQGFSRFEGVRVRVVG